MIRLILRSAFCVSWVALLVLRFDLFQAYGLGTGKNKLGFSPLDVLSFSAVHASRVRGQDDNARKAIAVVGFPGEVFREVTEGKVPDFSVAWESSLKWTKTAKMKPIMNVSKDPVSGLAALSSLLCALFAPRFPKEASIAFLCSIVLLQSSLRAYESSVKITEDFGMYALAMALAAYFF